MRAAQKIFFAHSRGMRAAAQAARRVARGRAKRAHDLALVARAAARAA